MSGVSVPKIWGGGDDPAIVKTFHLTVDDHLDVHYRAGHALPLVPTLGCMLLLTLFVALFTGYDRWQSGDYVGFTLHIVALVALVCIVTLIALRPMRWVIRRIWEKRLRDIDAIEIPVEGRIDQRGVHQTSARGHTYDCPWDTIHAIEEERGTFYIWHTQLSCFPWPARIFSSDEERRSFAENVSRWSGREIASPAFLARLGERGRQNLKDQRI